MGTTDTPDSQDAMATYRAFEKATDRQERMRLARSVVENNLTFLLKKMRTERIENSAEREAVCREDGMALRELGGLLLDAAIPGKGAPGWKLFRTGEIELPLKPADAPPLGLDPEE